jgi:hypothetical protein
MLQRAWPAGGSEQASAISWACAAPSKIGAIGGVSRFLRVSTASSPSSTSLARTRITMEMLVSSASQISASDQLSPLSP